MLDHAASLLQTATAVEQLSDITLDVIHAECFMVTTHRTTLDLLRAEAADHDGYISTLIQIRQHHPAANRRLMPPSPPRSARTRPAQNSEHNHDRNWRQR